MRFTNRREHEARAPYVPGAEDICLSSQGIAYPPAIPPRRRMGASDKLMIGDARGQILVFGLDPRQVVLRHCPDLPGTRFLLVTPRWLHRIDERPGHDRPRASFVLAQQRRAWPARMLREESAMPPVVLAAVRNILPLACAYYLSFLFRMINAVLAHDVAQTMGLGAASLGIMTSAYFLAYAGASLPLGVMLDRYGPRRVQGCLMLVAALGAALFAIADSVVVLYVGRALIGVGVAGGLMAGLKAIVMWVPRRRVPTVTG